MSPYSDLFDEEYPRVEPPARGDGEDVPFDCAACLEEDIWPEDKRSYLVEGKIVCQDCVTSCEVCGELLDDENRAEFGPSVRYRQWEVGGRLSDPAHAVCAANWLLGLWANETLFDFTEHGADDIASIVSVYSRIKAA